MESASLTGSLKIIQNTYLMMESLYYFGIIKFHESPLAEKSTTLSAMN
jgi:hypothetical protein